MDLVEIEVDEAAFELRHQVEVTGRVGEVERSTAMARAFGDDHTRRATGQGFVKDCFHKLFDQA